MGGSRSDAPRAHLSNFEHRVIYFARRSSMIGTKSFSRRAGHPKAKRAYAWSSEREDCKRRFYKRNEK
jgi:hypothetical protein